MPRCEWGLMLLQRNSQCILQPQLTGLESFQRAIGYSLVPAHIQWRPNSYRIRTETKRRMNGFFFFLATLPGNRCNWHHKECCQCKELIVGGNTKKKKKSKGHLVDTSYIKLLVIYSVNTFQNACKYIPLINCMSCSSYLGSLGDGR